MIDNQDLANGIGATLRAAEAAAANEGATETAVHLASLHDQLGQAFHAANALGADLDWNPIAGNSSAASRSGGPVANSGGTNKGEPPAQQ